MWDNEKKATSIPIIAGWYSISFHLDKVDGENPEIKITGTNPNVKTPLNKTIKLAAEEKGKRTEVSFFTGYEGYGYTRSKIKIESLNCEISKILFEKSRPSKKASIYGKGVYIDTKTKPTRGELVEKQ